MKYLNKLLTSGLFVCLLYSKVYSQEILTDHKSDVLFSIPTTVTTPSLSFNNVGLSTRLWKIKQLQYYIVDEKGARINTMLKSYAVNLKGNLVDNSEDHLIFSGKTSVTPTFEISFNNTLDILQDADQKNGFYSTFSLAFTLQYQKLDVYDKLSPTLPFTKYNQWNPGAKLVFDIFHRTNYALAFSASYQHIVNTDNLTAVQLKTSDFYTDINVATNGKKDGYLAPVAAKDAYRVSVALPIFSLFGKTPDNIQLVPTPYYFVKGESFHRLAHNAGIALSILPKKIFKTKKTEFKSAFSVSYNLINSGDKTNGRFLFISGAFSFGSHKEAPDDSSKH